MPTAMVRELSGTQKAAVLLLQMGKERASKVLAAMHESEVEEIAAEIIKLGSLSTEVSESVLAEFHSMITGGAGGTARGGLDAARDMLHGSLGRLRAEDMLERVSHSPGRIPFDFLRDADPRQLLNILGNEHPQTIALVLAHLRAEQASRILTGLGDALQGDVAVRIAGELGGTVVNFDVNGDAGATSGPAQVTAALLSVSPGSIVIAHMNQPSGGTAAGVAAALPRLTEGGFRFVRLSEHLPRPG